MAARCTAESGASLASAVRAAARSADADNERRTIARRSASAAARETTGFFAASDADTPGEADTAARAPAPPVTKPSGISRTEKISTAIRTTRITPATARSSTSTVFHGNTRIIGPHSTYCGKGGRSGRRENTKKWLIPIFSGCFNT
jgi:hypothetical protein